MLPYWASSASFLFFDSSDTSFVFTTIWACFSIMLAMAWTSAAVWGCKSNTLTFYSLTCRKKQTKLVLVVYTQVCVLATNYTECTNLCDYERGKLFLSNNKRKKKTWRERKYHNAYWNKQLSAGSATVFAILFQEITWPGCSKTQK